MDDRVTTILERLDTPVRPRPEFEGELLRACLDVLAAPHLTQSADAIIRTGDAVNVGQPPRQRIRWWPHRRASVAAPHRWRSWAAAGATATLLAGLLVASRLAAEHRSQVGPGPVAVSPTVVAPAHFDDLLRADYAPVAADVERVGWYCVFVPSRDLGLCRTFVLQVRTDAQTMLDHVTAASVPETLAGSRVAIIRDLVDLVASSDEQLANIDGGVWRCCVIEDARSRLHDDVFAAMGTPPSAVGPSGSHP